MALIEVFHVVASEIAVDPVSTTDIPQGVAVTLDSLGFVTVAAPLVAGPFPVGIAGDSRSRGTSSFTPDSGSGLLRDANDNWVDPVAYGGNWPGALVMGAWGNAERNTQNRVADNFNEVLASGKMTVYHSGGEFYTDQYCAYDNAVAQTFTPGMLLYVVDTNANTVVGQISPKSTLDNNSTEKGTFNVVGMTLRAPDDYPSGVPGVNTGFTHLPEGGNSMTYGRFLHFKLVL